MEKVAPNSNFVCRFSEINLHSKTKGPLRYFWGGRLCIHKWNNTNSKPCRRFRQPAKAKTF